jgi:hypothetical protein
MVREISFVMFKKLPSEPKMIIQGIIKNNDTDKSSQHLMQLNQI